MWLVRVSPSSTCCLCPLLRGPEWSQPAPPEPRRWGLGSSSLCPGLASSCPLPSPRETRVLAASPHSEPCSPHVLPSEARAAPALCHLSKSRIREATACRHRPSVLKARSKDPPRSPCFWQERQPPPASQSGCGSRRLGRGGSLGPPLWFSV